MDIKYNVVKLKDGSTEEIKDSVSVEEPLEMSLKYKADGKYHLRSKFETADMSTREDALQFHRHPAAVHPDRIQQTQGRTPFHS